MHACQFALWKSSIHTKTQKHMHTYTHTGTMQLCYVHMYTYKYTHTYTHRGTIQLSYVLHIHTYIHTHTGTMPLSILAKPFSWARLYRAVYKRIIHFLHSYIHYVLRFSCVRLFTLLQSYIHYILKILNRSPLYASFQEGYVSPGVHFHIHVIN
jgi:hypothetical protein